MDCFGCRKISFVVVLELLTNYVRQLTVQKLPFISEKTLFTDILLVFSSFRIIIRYALRTVKTNEKHGLTPIFAPQKKSKGIIKLTSPRMGLNLRCNIDVISKFNQ